MSENYASSEDRDLHEGEEPQRSSQDQARPGTTEREQERDKPTLEDGQPLPEDTREGQQQAG
jgi:hypothetical protein